MNDDWFDGLLEDWGSFLGLFDCFAHVGSEPLCSRGTHRALVVAIIQWVVTCTGMIFGPSWTGFGLHALHTRLVCTSLGCRESYSTSSHVRPHVSGGNLADGVGSSVQTSSKVNNVDFVGMYRFSQHQHTVPATSPFDGTPFSLTRQGKH